VENDASRRCRIVQSYSPDGANGIGTGDSRWDASSLLCRLITGKDVTEWLSSRAVQMRRRSRRDVHDNSVMSKYDDPRIIAVNDRAVPPSVGFQASLCF